MKFIDEYRDAHHARRYAEALNRLVTRPWTIMEVCGGQTHAIVRFGVDELLPSGVTLVHGPGCPVCVTPVDLIDAAIEIASRPGVIFTSFGDMLRRLPNKTQVAELLVDISQQGLGAGLEFELLRVFLASAGNVLSRQDIAREVFHRPMLAMDRTLSVHVCSLRRKLGEAPRGGERIKTVHGVGYIYLPPSEGV